jgi:hypothetical protein
MFRPLSIDSICFEVTNQRLVRSPPECILILENREEKKTRTFLPNDCLNEIFRNFN